MGRATLFRHMATLEQCGLVTRHARGDGNGGRCSNQYELHLDVTLGPSSRQSGKLHGVGRVDSQIETGGKVSKRVRKSLKGETGLVSNVDTNLTNEPKKEPPAREDEAEVVVENSEAEKVLAAYPQDKIRDRKTSLRQILVALGEGLSSDDLESAAAAYANETQGYTRSKVCFSDNWFRMRRWETQLAQIHANREKARKAETKGRADRASWIRERHPLSRHITAAQLDDLLKAKLVTPDQVRAAGLVA